MNTSQSIEKKFNAAVNVIQCLPKDGPFQPSHQMMLTFYAYFKQAKFGQCNAKKPAFWDVVGKAKWEAWNSLGSMSQEQAMKCYVEELKKIVEMMPQTGNVQNFVETLENFYEQVIVDGASNDILNMQMNNKLIKDYANVKVENEDLQSTEDVDSDSNCYLDTSDIPIEDMTLASIVLDQNSLKAADPVQIIINENVEVIKKILEDSLKELKDKQNALLQQMQQIKKLQVKMNKSKKYDILTVTFIVCSAFTTFSLLNKIVNYFRKKRIKK